MLVAHMGCFVYKLLQVRESFWRPMGIVGVLWIPSNPCATRNPPKNFILKSEVISQRFVQLSGTGLLVGWKEYYR